MRKILVTTTLVVLLALVGSTAVLARSQSRYSTDGRNVSTYWTQVDGPPAADPSKQPFGNVHVGWLDAWETTRGNADVFAYIDDFRCPTGVLPHDWGHGEEQEAMCEYVGTRFGEGYGLALTVDRKLTTARLTGQLIMTHGGNHFGGGGAVVGRPKADITWTAQGATYRSTGTFRGVDGRSRYTDRYTGTTRNATMSGTLGPMGFAPDLSGGSISSYRSMYREQSR